MEFGLTGLRMHFAIRFQLYTKRYGLVRQCCPVTEHDYMLDICYCRV